MPNLESTLQSGDQAEANLCVPPIGTLTRTARKIGPGKPNELLSQLLEPHESTLTTGGASEAIQDALSPL